MMPATVTPSIHGLNHSLVTTQQNTTHVPQILLLLLIGVLASLGAPPPALSSIGGPKMRCYISGQEYEINQTWYKNLRTSNANICVRCTCRSVDSENDVNCSNVTCSPAMCGDLKKDECCDVCQGSPGDEQHIKSLSAVSGGPRLPCLHSGRIYQDGEEFLSNATGLQAQKPNQCIHCVCQSGLVLCRLRTCDLAHCLSPDTKDCCPTCKDEPASELASQTNPVLVTIMVSDSQSQSGDCTAAGVTYSHGSSWHPVIGPFGPMDCVFCKCQDGKIECSRLNCPPIQKLPCAKPIQVPGHCCPLCAAEGQASPSVLTEDIQPTLQQPPISVTMEHKGSPRVHGSAVKPDATVNCLPPQTNTVVFRSHASSSSSAYYQYAFQSVTGDYSTRLLTWTVKDGHVGDFSEQHLSQEEFKTLMGTFKFKVQGATRTKFMEKFLRKAKRLPDHCGNRCSMKIQRLEQVLHLREVVRKPLCLAQETSFH